MTRSSDDTPPPPTVDYAPTLPGVSRRAFRMLLVLTSINTILLGVYVVGPTANNLFSQQWAKYQETRRLKRDLAAARIFEQQCMRFTLPAGQFVYAEDDAGAARMQQDVAIPGSVIERVIEADSPLSPRSGHPLPRGFNEPLGCQLPSCFTQLAGFAKQDFHSTDKIGALVFMHERKTPSGQPRLVIARFTGDASLSGMVRESEQTNGLLQTRRQLTISVREPVSLSGSAVRSVEKSRDHVYFLSDPKNTTLITMDDGDANPRIERHGTLRVHAGQADSNDPTCFSVPYEFDGQFGRIDCQLRESTVTFAVTGLLNALQTRSPRFVDAMPPSPRARGSDSARSSPMSDPSTRPSPPAIAKP